MLADKGVQDEDILARLAALEKTQETSPDAAQTLTHRTVNQLQKAEKVFESTKRQIQELDKQWVSFNEYIRNKHAEQSALYKTKRKQLVDKNKETIIKMKELREEIQKAAVKKEPIEIPEDFHKEPNLASFDVDLTGLSDSEDEKKDEKGEKKGTTRPAEEVASSPAKAARKAWGLPLIRRLCLWFTRMMIQNVHLISHSLWLP